MEKIVFLYKQASVPNEIIEAAEQKTPPDFELILCEEKMSSKERRQIVSEADYFMLYTVGFDDVDVAKKAKLMQILSAGYDRLDVHSLKSAGIPLATNGGANAPTVAEHTILLILALYRKLPLHHTSLKNGQWHGHRVPDNAGGIDHRGHNRNRLRLSDVVGLHGTGQHRHERHRRGI